MRTYASAKIHRARVTRAELDYTGSIGIGSALFEAAGLHEFQQVHINGYPDGAHWETYVMLAEDHHGVELNGPPARLFQPGDEVVIVSYELLEVQPTGMQLVFVDENNRVVDCYEQEQTW